MDITTNNLILNRLFTQNIFSNLLIQQGDPTYYSVVQRYVNNPEDKNNGELISEIYSFMSKTYRNEYFYQNTLLNRLLLGKHSPNTTTALKQIPIGKSKADFILINGKAVVYEIKTELDSFERLGSQLKDYYTGFNHVCVVTSLSQYEKALELLKNTPVGIYALTAKNKLSAKFKKEPVTCNEYLLHTSLFKILHKKEYEKIILEYFRQLPSVSQVFYYNECLRLFEEIPIFDAYTMTLNELKKRNRIVIKNFQEVPYELKSLAYFFGMKKADVVLLNGFLNKRFGG